MTPKPKSVKSTTATPGDRETVDGIILLNLDLQPVAIDTGGRSILRDLETGDLDEETELRLPMDVEYHLRAAAETSVTATLRTTADEGDYHWRVFVIHPQNGLMTERLLAVYVKKDRSIAEVVRRVGHAHGLTAREQEVLVGVAMGLTSRELAVRLNISPNTVNAFLRLIMGKMGVTTRAGIVGKLLQHKSVVKENGARENGGRTGHVFSDRQGSGASKK